jgi:diguanylate cyclase (GGDEF)-like protein
MMKVAFVPFQIRRIYLIPPASAETDTQAAGFWKRSDKATGRNEMSKQIPASAILSAIPFSACPVQMLPAGLQMGSRSAAWPHLPNWLVAAAVPDWIDFSRPVPLMAVALLLTFAAGMRAWLIERKVRRQMANQAYIEQRRGSILEDINSSRPLAEILESITELVSARLNGAPCWCQIAGGARIGAFPTEFQGLRIVEQVIRARSGPSLGLILTAFASGARPNPIEKEALDKAAGLATLAIETSRLYSDLVHRSEFDQLTEIPNRFAFDRQLERMIERARRDAGNFGLVYIDLDDFKQVNDLFGHQAGDAYLQEIAQRFKRQLRPSDTLARMGGDEFAVLVPNVRNYDDLAEVAARLQHSFDEPIVVAGEHVSGSGSFGMAVYPTDAAGKDGLLSAADSAMYAAKNIRRVLQR